MKTKFKKLATWFTVFVLAFQIMLVLPARAETFPQLMNIASDGSLPDSYSQQSTISADGRYVAFDSYATNLVSNDTNGMLDVFVHDRQTGQTTRASVASDGTQGNGGSLWPSISADGRYIVFGSNASNFASGDTNGITNIFLHDNQTGTTTRVSTAPDGSQGNGQSIYPEISADGQFITFASEASNLIPEGTNGTMGIFVRNNLTGQITRTDISSNGTQANSQSIYPSISADGRYVAFTSISTNLVTDDTNSTWDVFVHDNQTGQTTRVNVSSSGSQTEGEWYSHAPSISADGRYVTFMSWATNLVSGDTNQCYDGLGYRSCYDVFVHDNQTGQTTRVSVASNGDQGNSGSYLSSAPSISSDGRYVTFYSAASNLVSGDINNNPDVFVHDTQTGNTAIVSMAFDNTQGNSASSGQSISADGHYIAYMSSATNLIPGGIYTYGSSNVFLAESPLFTSPNQPPLANPGPNQTANIGNMVTLDGSASSDPDGNNPLTYAWSFISAPQGSTAVVNNPTSVNPTFTPDIAGNYAVSLTVTDSLGLSSQPSTVTVTAVNPAPAAPTNLVAASALTNQHPSLSWTAVSSATSYNVYRNGAVIGTSTNTSYVDTSAAQNTYSYYVTAVNTYGESSPSNTVNITVDTTGPVVTVTPVSGSFLTGTVTFNITVTDNNPLAANKNLTTWVYLYDTAGVQKHWGAKVNLSSGHGTFTINTALLDNGNANLDVGVTYDAAGNASGRTDSYFRNYTIGN
jgi:Tol biopolymer transport system component